MIFPLALWWRAVHAAAPAVSLETFTGMSIAPANLSVCAPNCDCRLLHALDLCAAGAVEECGFRLVPLNPPGWAPARTLGRVRHALSRRMPVAYVGEKTGGIVTAWDDSSPRALVFTSGPSALAAEAPEEEIDVGVLLSSRLYALARARESRGLRSRRTITLLLEWAAAAHRPPTAGGCVKGGPLQRHGGGLAAYGLWAEAEKADSAAEFRNRAAAWREEKGAGADWLSGLAGSGRSRPANLLRRAADGVRYELETYWQAGAEPAIRSAAHVAEETAHEIMEAALTRSGLPITAVRALLEESESRLEGVSLTETLYLARAGVRPLRELAALRLAGAESAQAASTLGQLLHDPVGRVASTALWALTRRKPENLLRTLLNAARYGERERAGLDYPFTLSLLAAYADADASPSESLQDFRASVAAEDDSAPLLSDLDSILAALPRG